MGDTDNNTIELDGLDLDTGTDNDGTGEIEDIDPGAEVDAAMDKILGDDEDDDDDTDIKSVDDDASDDDDDLEDDNDDDDLSVDNESWKSASAALLARNFTAEEIEGMSQEQVLAIGGRFAKEDAESSGDDDKEPEKTPEEQAAELTDRQNTVIETIAEKLTGSTFDAAESKLIGEQLVYAVSELTGSDKSTFAESNEFKAMSAEVESMKAYTNGLRFNASVDSLKETYPQLMKSDGVEKVAAEATKLVKQGMTFDTMDDLIQAASLTVFGAEQTKEITKARAKVNKHKANGSPTAVKKSKRPSKPDDEVDSVMDGIMDDLEAEER